MGMSNWILDNEEQFWNKADEVIGECEAFEEFVGKMKPHTDLLTGSPSEPENDVDFEKIAANFVCDFESLKM